MLKEPVIYDPNNPLVTVTIHNYNYGRYLRQCLDSVFDQSYNNIEICFSDNASNDDSWDIALNYARKFPGIMTITCNRKNFGSDANFANCYLNVRGKYLIELCSDDALLPGYVERCVQALEANPTVGFAMVHRKTMDENEVIADEPPFYNQSCIIHGPEQAAVYMMASVNPSISQIMYNCKVRYGKEVVGGIAANWFGTRILDFNICCEHPIIYLKEPYMIQRVHSQNDTSRVATNLMDILGPYILQHQFVEIASRYDLAKVMDRLDPSIEKLSRLCLRYCVRFLSQNDDNGAIRYYHLAIALMPSIQCDPVFRQLEEYWSADMSRKLEIAASLGSADNLATRSVSYDPPPGSINLDNEKKPGNK
jgi:glycosyltransferase involved in cell wall biosynthesis